MGKAAPGDNPAHFMAALSAAVWGWALALLATRQVQILDCSMVAPAPPAWGFLSLPTFELLAIPAAAFGVGWAVSKTSPASRRQRVCAWLTLTAIIPALDLTRLAGIEIPVLFWESLWFAIMTGVAAAHWRGGSLPSPEPSTETKPDPAGVLWFGVTWLALLAAMMWWYVQAALAFDNFQLGFQDFGQFARRVVNTWEGRGFLSKTPSLPPFWDHFNPGLALLAPLWGLWPSPKLFLLIQAICLTLPAVFVYGISRRFHGSPLASCCWSLVFLMHPAIGQMNLNYTYGWHPVSLAMPLMFATIYALASKRYFAAAICAALACSFNEAVFVALGCLAAMMAVTRWLQVRSTSQKRSAPWDGALQRAQPLAMTLPWMGWLTVWAIITLGFVLVWKFAGFNEFQDTRVASQLHWKHGLKIESVWFVLGLLTPVGIHLVSRAWPVSVALLPPFAVLLFWSYEHSTSLAFQYTSTLAPVLITAAIAGSSARPPNATNANAQPAETAVNPGNWPFGVLAMAFFAAMFYGALPGSRPTMQRTTRLIYPSEEFLVNPDRLAGSAGIAALREVVELANDANAAVLATGYVAPHLLNVRRLEPVNEAATERREALANEAGENRAWIELFDWIVLDTQENFQQGADLTRSVVDEAQAAGFQVTFSRHGVVALKRP